MSTHLPPTVLGIPAVVYDAESTPTHFPMRGFVFKPVFYCLVITHHVYFTPRTLGPLLVYLPCGSALFRVAPLHGRGEVAATDLLPVLAPQIRLVGVVC